MGNFQVCWNHSIAFECKSEFVELKSENLPMAGVKKGSLDFCTMLWYGHEQLLDYTEIMHVNDLTIKIIVLRLGHNQYTAINVPFSFCLENSKQCSYFSARTIKNECEIEHTQLHIIETIFKSKNNCSLTLACNVQFFCLARSHISSCCVYVLWKFFAPHVFGDIFHNFSFGYSFVVYYISFYHWIKKFAMLLSCFIVVLHEWRFSTRDLHGK